MGMMDLCHEFDSSLTCNYCGRAAESTTDANVFNYNQGLSVCPKRLERATKKCELEISEAENNCQFLERELKEQREHLEYSKRELERLKELHGSL